MKEHLIVGFGRWGKIIFKNIKNKGYFDNIYLQTSKYFLKYNPKKKKFSPLKKIPPNKKFYSAHICTPIKKHYYFAKNIKSKKIIIEKPTFEKIKQFYIFSKKKNLITNYSDLYSPGIQKIFQEFKKFKTGEFRIIYKNLTLKYKKKNECLNDWLDHPLSLIFFFFKKKLEFKIIRFERNKIKGYFCENIEILFLNRKFKIILSLITNSRDKRKKREFSIKNNIKSIKYNFYKSNYEVRNNKVKKLYNFEYNSIINLYRNYILRNKMQLSAKKNFSKNIFLIKKKIIKLCPKK